MVASLADDRAQLVAQTRAQMRAQRRANAAAQRVEASRITWLAEPIAVGLTGRARVVGYPFSEFSLTAVFEPISVSPLG